MARETIGSKEVLLLCFVLLRDGLGVEAQTNRMRGRHRKAAARGWDVLRRRDT